MKFKASLDRITVIISIMVVIFFVALTVWVIYFVPDLGIYGNISIATGLATIVVSFLLYPTGYFVDDKSVAVKGVLFSRTILKEDIIAVEEIKTEDMSATIRAFGSGGFFGYFGLFYNSKHKWMIWFATQRKNYVMVHTAKRKFVFTPDNPQEFIAALQ